MKNTITAFLLFIAFTTIYYLGSFTRIPFADCVGFILTTEIGDFATSATATSHFLYVNTAILIKNIFGLNGIEANKVLVILSGAASVALVYFSVLSLRATQLMSIVAAIVFGFSFSFWRNAEIAEVYTYNSFWICLFFLCLIRSFYTDKKIYIILSGLFFGISLWVHIQNILMIPAFLLFIYHFRQEKKYAFISLVLFGSLFSFLFILNYLQGLPLNSPYSSDQGHWVEDSFKKSFSQYFFDLIKSVLYLVYNYTIFIFFGIIGIIALYQENKKMFYVFLLGSVFVYGFSTFYAVSDNYVFFLPFNIIFAIAIGFGFSKKVEIFNKLKYACLLIPAFYIAAFTIVGQTEKGKEFDDFKAYKGGLNYYLLPWLNDNKGILEFVIDKKTATEAVNWMTASAEDYIKVLKEKGYTESEIRKL